MTIGIGAKGPNSGLAVFRALAAAEAVSQGAIGGFCVFAAIDAKGRLWWSETQRGGTSTLFTHGEQTGSEPPEAIATAPFAALMSSGPDRPAPLSQFLAADASVGLVTGHRLPNLPGLDGIEVNQAVLGAMRCGHSAEIALAKVLRDNSRVDAGMIALGPDVGLAAQNSDRVAERPDLGTALLQGPGGTAVAVLHNAIAPAASLAPMIAEIALLTLAPPPLPAGYVVVSQGVPLVVGPRNRVIVDASLTTLCIETEETILIAGRHTCAAIYLGAQVVQDDVILGHTTAEPNVLVEDGRILCLSGQTQFAIPFIAQ